MRILNAAAALAAATLLAGCPDASREPAAATGGTIVVASPEPDILLPPMVQTASGRAITDVVYERLAEIGGNMNTIGDAGFAPRVAERWTWASDSLSIAFHLNARARWHDGRPVRAEDVRASFALYKDSTVAGGTAPLLQNVDSVTVRDSMTAVAWYRARTPEQFYELVYNVVIMPAHLVGGRTAAELREAPIARAPVGTGRFRVARWEAGTRVELVADTAHYRQRAVLDRVVFTPVPDFNAGITQLLAGQADFFEFIPPPQQARVDSSEHARTMPYPGFQYAMLGFNLRSPGGRGAHPIFGDRRVRLALSMAVDRRAMLQNVFGTRGQLSYGPFPRSHSTADTTLQLPAYDVARANALLDSAGWTRGRDSVRVKAGRPLAFRILVPTSSQPRMRYAVLLQEQLRAVGARVEIDAQEFATFAGNQGAGRFDAVLAGLATDASPAGVRQWFGSAAIGTTNAIGYANPAFDALVDSGAASHDPQRSRAFMTRAYQALADDAPAIWLYDVPLIAGIHRRISVTGLRPDGWWVGLADWSIPPEKRIARDEVGLGAPER